MNTVEIHIMFDKAIASMEEEKRKKEEQRIISKIEQLQELEELMAEAKAETEKLKDEIKAEMYKRNTEEMKVGKYIVRWTDVLSNRFDSTKFKELFPEMYKQFTKQVSSRRFSIAWWLYKYLIGKVIEGGRNSALFFFVFCGGALCAELFDF